MLLIGHAAGEICFNQSEIPPRSRYWRVISMEFLRSFLRRHFAGKPVVSSRNVLSFLRLFFLLVLVYFTLFRHEDSTLWQRMKQDLRPNWYQPFHYHPARERLYHATGATTLNLYEEQCRFFHVPKNQYRDAVSCETGPTVFRFYTRRLEFLTISRCQNKGSKFSSVVLRPWVLFQSQF